jgi:vesicle transport through interaction with t-SNAREs protein 1
MIPFERYDEEFKSLTEQVTSKLRAFDHPNAISGGGFQQQQQQQTSSSGSSSSGGGASTSESDLRMASALLQQAEDLLKQMGLEARTVEDVTSKRDLLGKVRVCKARLANLRDDYESAKAFFERTSLGLLPPPHSSSRKNGGGGDIESSNNYNRSAQQRLLSNSNTDALQSQNDTLANARSIMAETESVALEITEELGRHRETIQSAHGRVRQVSGLTNRARRIVQSMSRREVQQKLILYGVAGVIALVFLMLVWGMFR